MPTPKKSWHQKLHDSKDLPKIIKIDATRSKRWGNGTCVIPAPLEVDALMRRIPKGRLTTIDHLRQALAKKHGTTIACPVTTGIFAWIAAHASAESKDKKSATPFWRTLKSNGGLNPKYPGGIAGLKKRLNAEGHKVKQRGKRFFVEEFDAALASLDGIANSLNKIATEAQRTQR